MRPPGPAHTEPVHSRRFEPGEPVPGSGPRLLTAGHGTATGEELAGLLRGACVELVVDVRSAPAAAGSRSSAVRNSRHGCPQPASAIAGSPASAASAGLRQPHRTWRFAIGPSAPTRTTWPPSASVRPWRAIGSPGCAQKARPTGTETRLVAGSRCGHVARTGASLASQGSLRRRIVSPSHASRPLLWSAARSFSGMIALSVILISCGHTSVQHLVMLQSPSPCISCT